MSGPNERLQAVRSLSGRGLGIGLATTIGFPLALVVFLAQTGELIGLEATEDWLQPIVAAPSFVLAGIGLHGLNKRLDIPDSKTSTMRGVWLGVGLGLAGIAGMYSPTGFDFFAGFTLPLAFVSLTLSLATMGLIALRAKTFGVLSVVPLAVAVSAGVWFLSLPRQFTGSFHGTAQMYTLVVHIALWFILGVVLATDHPGYTDSGPSSEEQVKINRS